RGDCLFHRLCSYFSSRKAILTVTNDQLRQIGEGPGENFVVLKGIAKRFNGVVFKVKMSNGSQLRLGDTLVAAILRQAFEIVGSDSNKEIGEARQRLQIGQQIDKLDLK